ncbi:hypothetical protein LDENG_00079790 [Lucifuga dentata]|nr:hypothetical protein LDENG_00079790 [Lucifuga dentata]
MGQNQEKVDGGEQGLGEGLEERGSCSDSGGASSDTCGVMKGENPNEETGCSGENLGKLDAQVLDESPGNESIAPSSEEKIRSRVSTFTAREVRQGGAAGKGGEEGGGEVGGRTASLVPREEDKSQNPKSSGSIEERTGTYKLFNQKEKKSEEELHISSKVKMEYQAKETGPLEESQDEMSSVEVLHEKFDLPVLETMDITSMDSNSLGIVMEKISKCGAPARINDDPTQRSGSMLLLSVQHDQTEVIMAENEDEDIKHGVGTVDHLGEMKELPTAQHKAPLKNSLEKESVLALRNTFHYRLAKERAKNNTIGETLTHAQGSKCFGETKPHLNDYFTRKSNSDSDIQRESGWSSLQMARAAQNDKDNTIQTESPLIVHDLEEETSLHIAETDTNQEIPSYSASTPVLPIETSSILEKLLSRNKKEAIPVLSKIKDVEIGNKDTVDVECKVEVNAMIIPDSQGNNRGVETGMTTEKTDQSDVHIPSSLSDTEEIIPSCSNLTEKPTEENHGTKDFHSTNLTMDQTGNADNKNSDVPQPGVHANIYETSFIKSACYDGDCQSSEQVIISADSPVKEELKMNTGSKKLPSEDLQSAVSDEGKSCEVSGVIAEEFAPSSVSPVIADAKSPPKQSDGHIESCSLLTDEKNNTSPVNPSLQISNDNERKTAPQVCGSENSDDQDKSGTRQNVKDPTCDILNAALTGSGLVEVRTYTSEENHQDMADMKHNEKKQQVTPKENMIPGQADEKTDKERDESVIQRDKSQIIPKPRPVSDLIKETIQLHEKLLQQDRPQPHEVRADSEQVQSVKVAQMKAAFDSAQKSPDKALERKPSVKKGSPSQRRGGANGRVGTGERAHGTSCVSVAVSPLGEELFRISFGLSYIILLSGIPSFSSQKICSDGLYDRANSAMSLARR